VTLLNARRRLREFEPENQRICLNLLLRKASAAWHGVKLGQPDWNPNSHTIALTVEIPREKMFVHLIFNAYWQPLDFELPRLDRAGENPWRLWIDTGLNSPHDIVDWDMAQSVIGSVYRAEARSVAVLFTRV
jgi:glycogen operon protein